MQFLLPKDLLLQDMVYFVSLWHMHCSTDIDCIFAWCICHKWRNKDGQSLSRGNFVVKQWGCFHYWTKKIFIYAWISDTAKKCENTSSRKYLLDSLPFGLHKPTNQSNKGYNHEVTHKAYELCTLTHITQRYLFNQSQNLCHCFHLFYLSYFTQ